MKVIITKPTVVKGKPVKVGETLELTPREAKSLVSMNRAKIVEQETQKIEVQLSTEVKEQIENATKKLEDEYEENLQEHREEIERLNKTINELQEEIKVMKEDIHNTTLKELKKKYPIEE